MRTLRLRSIELLSFFSNLEKNHKIITYVSLLFLSVSAYFLRAGNEDMKVKYAALESRNQGLIESMAIYNHVYEDFPLPVFQKVKRGDEFIMQYVNKKYVQEAGHSFNYDKNAQIGKNNFELFPKKYAQKFYEIDIAVSITGEKFEAVEDFYDKEGNPIYAKVIKWREIKNKKDTLVYGMIKGFYKEKPVIN